MKKTQVNIEFISHAARFAIEKHKGQIDDNGKPHSDHVCKVADLVSQVYDDPDVVAAAYLHDTLEDTKTTYSELWHQFGQRVADLVNEVTHEGNKTTGYYFPRLRSREAIIIKFADRLHNLSRMDAWSDRRKLHYLKRSKFWKSEKSA